jgi:PPM family protein phosphatase
MRLKGYGRTDVGRKRGHNEDFLLVDPALGLFIVCDGMGGAAAGEVASETAARTAARVVAEKRALLASFDDTQGAREQLVRLVDDAIQEASREVYRVATSERGKAGMGTTMTVMLSTKNCGVMGHVGDSRLYMRRGGRTHQLSDDHTYVNEMIRRGMLTPEKAKSGPYQNVITRAVGIQPTVRADTLVFDVLPGDVFLLCSDGLYRHVERTDEIGALLGGDRLEGVASQLVDLANARGGSDNITCLVMHAEAEDGDAAEDRNRTTEVNLKLDTLRDVALFRQLEMKELVVVLNIVRAQTVEKGEVVVAEGSSGDALFAIVEGKLSVSRGGTDVAVLQRGSHFGEMALFNNRPRTATVRALEPSRLLVMDRARFNELLRKEPALAVKLLWSFAQVLSLRLDEASDQLYGRLTMGAGDACASPFDTPSSREGAPIS